MMRICMLLAITAMYISPIFSAEVEQSAAVPAAESPTPSPPPVVVPELPEYRRYRVSIRIAVAPQLGSKALYDRRYLDQVHSALRRYWGGCWDVQVHSEVRLQPIAPELISDLTPDRLLGLEPDPELDKLFVLIVGPQGSRWRISGVEFDRRSKLSSQPLSRDFADPREIPELAAAICSSLFRPIVRIEDVEGKTVQVRLFGGALLPPDPELSLAKSGSLWLPLSRSLPTQENPEERIQLVPWTYLRMEAPPTFEQTVCRCEVITGIRNPIPARRSARVESIALAVRPATSETLVRLIARGTAGQPLPAYEVDLMGEDKQVLQTFLSDRQGRVKLPGNPEQPLRWIQVRSGQLKIAQLPIVPGLLPTVDIEVPSDAPRLKVEAQLAVLQSRLMELVIQRALVMRHLKRVTDDEKWDQVDPLVKELQSLPSRDALKAEVAAIRVGEVRAAEKNKDRLSARRIEKLCDETSELIDRHLDQDKVKDLIEVSLQLRETEKKKAKQLEENPEADLKSIGPGK